MPGVSKSDGQNMKSALRPMYCGGKVRGDTALAARGARLYHRSKLAAHSYASQSAVAAIALPDALHIDSAPTLADARHRLAGRCITSLQLANVANLLCPIWKRVGRLGG